MNLPKKEKKLKKARSGAQNAELGSSLARFAFLRPVDQEGMKASMKNGILSLSVPFLIKSAI